MLKKGQTLLVKPSASLTIKGVPFALEFLNLSASVNSLPVASFKFNISNPKTFNSVDIDLNNFASIASNYQTYVFDNRTEPDVRILADDGLDGKVNFPCYLNNPQVEISSGVVNLKAVGLHEYSRLANLSFFPYKNYNNVMSSQAEDTFRKIHSPTASMSIAERILKLSEYYRDNPKTIQDFTGTLDSPVISRLLEINESLFPVLNKLLSESEDTVLPGSQFLRDSGPENGEINNALDAILFSPRGSNFISNLMGVITSQFLLQFVGNFNGGGGLEVSKVNALAEDVITVIPEQVWWGTSIGMTPPVSQVIVRSNSSPNIVTEQAEDQVDTALRESTGYLGVFPPEPFGSGRIEIIDAPSWIIKGPAQPLSATDFIEGVGNLQKGLRNFTIASVNNTWNRLTKQEKEDEAQFRLYCREWARRVYYQLALNGATASVSMPLKLNYQLGRTYKVVSSSGVNLFTGYLSSVNHTIQAGPNGIARTNLFFDYVRGPDFKLP